MENKFIFIAYHESSSAVAMELLSLSTNVKRKKWNLNDECETAIAADRIKHRYLPFYDRINRKVKLMH